jgi:crotonobetainyl-CoA:carnitine CoA-transferase CaiB-like acyl-CoA transferase
VAGGRPPYQVFRTAVGRFVAAAPLEQRFWETFCAVIALPAEHADDKRDPQGTRRAIAARIATRSADEWRTAFEGKDCCCVIVSSLQEAVQSRHFRERGLFAHQVETDAGTFTATPVPVAEHFRDPRPAGYPRLGADNDLLDEKR